jgi:hypothetical protein
MKVTVITYIDSDGETQIDSIWTEDQEAKAEGRAVEITEMGICHPSQVEITEFELNKAGE